jgi:hypothetical protein
MCYVGVAGHPASKQCFFHAFLVAMSKKGILELKLHWGDPANFKKRTGINIYVGI